MNAGEICRSPKFAKKNEFKNSESIKKVQTDLKRFSETILESTNHNLEIAQADIKAKLAENKENIEKIRKNWKNLGGGGVCGAT